MVANDYHLSVLVNVTLDELRQKLPSLEIFNGFANRFLWALVQRTRLDPSGGNVPDEILNRYGRDLAVKVRRARVIGEMHRTKAADDLWIELYQAMADDDPGGVVGAAIARAEAQNVRLAVTFAVLDGSRVVGVEHVKAAFAYWTYCRLSAGYIFAAENDDDRLGRLLAALRQAGEAGLTGTQQADLFARNLRPGALRQMRDILFRSGQAVTVKKELGGRPGIITRALL